MSNEKLNSDLDLVQIYLNERSDKNFNKIYDLTVRNVYRFVICKVGCREWAEDITSETYLTFMKAVEKYDATSKLSTFIIGIAKNKIFQFYEKNKNKESLSLDEDFFVPEIVEETSQYQLENKKLLHVLSLIPKRYKEILELRFQKMLSYKEIASRLDTSVEHVRVLQSRSLKKAAKVANKILQNNI